MGFTRHATARWEGDLKTGQGRMSTPQSGLFDGTRYSFGTRFGDEKGSNPEELLAAAHAGCYSMALGFILQNAGYTAERIDTPPGPHATGVELSVVASVPGLSAEEFARHAEDAKANCVISKLLSIPVSLDARLE
jgi:osmotically inducible protein OsmC